MKTKRERLLYENMSKGVLLVAASLFAGHALANNGMYLTGYGTESEMMSGADVAISRDAFASVNNPAGLTQLKGQEFEIVGVVYDATGAEHTDSFGNYRRNIDNWAGGYGSGAYGRRFEKSPFAAGIGLVIQGGLGWTYSGLNVNPAFGGPHRDDASALFTIVRLAPAVAWEVNDQLSLGVALGINSFSGDQELFPNTSAPGFAGFRFKGASGIGLNSKWGLQYRPMKDVTIGMTYGTQTSIPLKNGNLRINFSDPSFGSLGVVRYDNAKLTGLRLPEELAIGISFRPVASLLVSMQEKWYNWSDAINKLQLSATNPRNPLAQDPFVLPQSAADFVDQHVIAIGMAYDYDKDTVLIAGVNHGSRAITEATISPIFAPIQARHYSVGVKHQLEEGWMVGAGIEIYDFESVTYDHPIFGQGANERQFNKLLHLSIGRRW